MNFPSRVPLRSNFRLGSNIVTLITIQKAYIIVCVEAENQWYKEQSKSELGGYCGRMDGCTPLGGPESKSDV